MENYAIDQGVCFVKFKNLRSLLDEKLFTNNEFKALIIYFDECELDDDSFSYIEESISKIPCITIGIFNGKVGLKEIRLASKMDIRVSSAISQYDVNANDINNVPNISIILGREKVNLLKELSDKISNEDLLTIGFISRIFENSEDDEFKKWLYDHVMNKDVEQLNAIKKCFERYRFLLSQIKDRGFLVQEESRQFCLLASKIGKR